MASCACIYAHTYGWMDGWSVCVYVSACVIKTGSPAIKSMSIFNAILSCVTSTWYNSDHCDKWLCQRYCSRWLSTRKARMHTVHTFADVFVLLNSNSVHKLLTQNATIYGLISCIIGTRHGHGFAQRGRRTVLCVCVFVALRYFNENTAWIQTRATQILIASLS